MHIVWFLMTEVKDEILRQSLFRFPTHPTPTPSSQLRLLTPPRHRRCPPNTLILEISSRIHPHPSNATFKITTRHHSDAPSTHPLLRLMHSTNTPNCHLEEILIPEPSPHLKLFVVSSTTILPYTPLRIRPPPEPPPPQQPTTHTFRIEETSNDLVYLTHLNRL